MGKKRWDLAGRDQGRKRDSRGGLTDGECLRRGNLGVMVRTALLVLHVWRGVLAIQAYVDQQRTSWVGGDVGGRDGNLLS